MEFKIMFLGNSSVVKATDSVSRGRGFDSQTEGLGVAFFVTVPVWVL